MIAETIFATCLVLLAIAFDWLSNRIGACEQFNAYSTRLHARHLFRNAEFCLRLKRAQRISRERSSRIRRRVRNLERPSERPEVLP
jgi:hypothetical protein